MKRWHVIIRYNANVKRHTCMAFFNFKNIALQNYWSVYFKFVGINEYAFGYLPAQRKSL